MIGEELTGPTDVRDALVRAERLRCVGIVLAYIGAQRLAHRDAIVAVLESLASEMEHPELKR